MTCLDLLMMNDNALLYPDSSLGLSSKVFELKPGDNGIGRNPDNELAVSVDSVSRYHASIRQNDGLWELSDLDSSNGTFLNGQRIDVAAVLNDGDTITIGNARFTFRIEPGTTTETDGNEHTSALRLVDDDEDASVIINTQIPDQTPFRTQADVLTAEENLDRINQRLLALYRLSDILRGASRRTQIITALMDLVFENLPADRGVALAIEGEQEDLKPELYRFRDGVSEREFVLSKSITGRALHDHLAVLSRDVHLDKRFQGSESIIASDIRSAMCVPLAGKRSLMGLLFLDTKESSYTFTDDDLAFVSALASDAAMTLENLMLLEENIRQERLAAVGQTISGLAHNIKNILQLARGGSELIDMAIEKQNYDDIGTLWPITRRSIERMQALTHEMLDFSRQSKPNLEAADVNRIVKQLTEMIKGDDRIQRITVEVQLDDKCGHPIVDKDGLTKALMNLLSNSFDALQGNQDGRIVLQTENRPQSVMIRVKDNGPGIPDDIKAKVFQPFFSTKGSSGNGLGLSMTRKYLEDMGAQLELRSSAEDGCEFLIQIPTNTQTLF